MGRWGPTLNPSHEGESEKDLAMALRMEHFFIPNPSRFDNQLPVFGIVMQKINIL
ncbi:MULTISPECIES: hypothetical protein [Okeania]|uniref:hypothetical protein n=1 Tax=Okeania TaxID=1458928 RepID=UPI00137531FA|nr:MULTISPECIES: hypothetical protein [Okeania]NEP07187.1 hypothetical protein [Okeania sp. SIO4D6]NEP75008.1 hypothetical protein [Okeania sp. SIO2G5]NEP89682.1 hypothetical protein [Okeania sp. SIO2C2]NEP96060.1 hypothetical protein [Okeania sp. SIO2F5]NEQ93872.1 hypothetical protein [Okeania sp. SIO2G4]